jgi:NADPH-dependent 2,4-dienoyl-CoA reductase/sulfur reductase-like enzyme
MNHKVGIYYNCLHAHDQKAPENSMCLYSLSQYTIILKETFTGINYGSKLYNQKTIDCLIIGGGPAGISAALYLHILR